MSGTREQDRVTYADRPLERGAASLRKLEADKRIGQGQVASYLGPDGNALAITGDREAPYFKILYDAPALVPVSLIPQSAIAAVLIASTIASELHECWATDERPSTPTPPDRWLLVFDSDTAPNIGDVPRVAALKLCGLAAYDFTEAPFRFQRGIVLAISSAPNSYAPIAASSDWAITARVLPWE
jgi:hypothetical protein